MTNARLAIFCDVCGVDNRPDARFCWSCGAAFERQPPPETSATAERTDPALSAAVPSAPTPPVEVVVPGSLAVVHAPEPGPVVTPPATITTVTSAMEGITGNLACPQCRRDDYVQRVSALVAAGTVTGTSQGTSTGVGYAVGAHARPVLVASTTTTTTTNQSVLAQRFAAPPQPAVDYTWGCTVYVFCGLAMIIGGPWMFIELGQQSPGIGSLCGLILLLAGAGGLWWYFQEVGIQRAAVANQLPAWQRMMEKWPQTYYCGRCDGVFIPGPGATFVPTPSRTEFDRYLHQES